MCKSVVDTQFCTFSDDVRFGHIDEGSMDTHAAFVLNGGGNGQVCHGLVRTDELGSAVWVAGLVHGIYATEDVKGSEDFCPCQGIG